MNSKDFITRIQSSFLLLDEHKKYFIKNSDTYTDEQRSKMIKVLEKGEKDITKYAEHKQLELQQKHSHQLHQAMIEHEKMHKSELSVIEDALQNELINI